MTSTSVKTLFSLLQYVASYSLDHCHCLVSFCHLMCSAFAYENVHLVNNFALFGVGPVLLPALPVAGGHLHLTKDCQENFNGSNGETFSCPCVGKNFYRKQAFTRKKLYREWQRNLLMPLWEGSGDLSAIVFSSQLVPENYNFLSLLPLPIFLSAKFSSAFLRAIFIVVINF